jgi:hypothetical protein
MPHLNGGFVHVLAHPTRSGLLYYIGHRPNRRTRTVQILAGGFRNRDRAFHALSKQIKLAKDVVNPRDPMMKRVYAWENTHVEPEYVRERLNRDQILAMVYRVCGDFRIEPPEVYFIANFDYCYLARCEVGRPFMIMSESAFFLNTITILHELAHYMASLVGSRDNHGPIWVREYLRLLTTYTTFRLDDLIKSLRACRVSYRLPSTPFERRT